MKRYLSSFVDVHFETVPECSRLSQSAAAPQAFDGTGDVWFHTFGELIEPKPRVLAEVAQLNM